MSTHGWTNDSTWGVAGAADNTASFVPRFGQILATAKAGQIATAAEQLRIAVQDRRELAATLPSWVTLSEVNWTELVSSWAADM